MNDKQERHDMAASGHLPAALGGPDRPATDEGIRPSWAPEAGGPAFSKGGHLAGDPPAPAPDRAAEAADDRGLEQDAADREWRLEQGSAEPDRH